ncbi:hypothetical protein BDQ17DRAFT_1437383 [Cyathus striatus]|nr:hypothetical protein BDQ17DRAFT_1437383 [Cyathus striatus]
MGPTPYEIAESNWPKVSSFLKRSGCPPLEILELEAYSFTDTIISVLAELPTLQKLSLVEKEAHNTHFILLTEKLGSDFDPRFNINSETAFLPLLKELRYVSSHKWYGDVGRAY